jgi:hypothetical protein
MVRGGRRSREGAALRTAADQGADSPGQAAAGSRNPAAGAVVHPEGRTAAGQAAVGIRAADRREEVPKAVAILAAEAASSRRVDPVPVPGS